jgi:hypothetical protein
MFAIITVRGEGPAGSGGSQGRELAEWRRSEASGHHSRRGLVRRKEDEKGKVEEEERWCAGRRWRGGRKEGAR